MSHAHFPVRKVLPAFVLLVALVPAYAPAADAAADAEQRIGESVAYLASDELEGRGIGTQGIDLAADYIAKRFSEMGLKTDLFGGSAFQKFTMIAESRPGETNLLALVGRPSAEGGEPARIELVHGVDFNTLSLGGSGAIDLPLVFVGYGITGRDEAYDDYEGIDVQGKAVIILRKEPQQANPHSQFNGTRPSGHAPYVRKVSNAYEHGAAAVIFCTDDYETGERLAQHRKDWDAAVDALAAAHTTFKEIARPTADQIAQHRAATAEIAKRIDEAAAVTAADLDPLVPFFAGGGGAEGRPMPVVHCRRTVLNQIVTAALGEDLASIEQKIDETPSPYSRELTGWRIAGEVSVVKREVEVKNVVGVLEGEGPLADETIVIGAHYDHLGRGGNGSLDAGSTEIHNGADDNGSGTAALLEVAQRLAERRPLPRRVVFIAFTAEERGLIGSEHYVNHPLYPLDNTVAMLNMDMVGRLKEGKLTIFGNGTATEWDPLIDELQATYGFETQREPSGFGPSDHQSFYVHKIPVLHWFSGYHEDYHRPSDDSPLLNVEGMRRIAEMVADVGLRVAQTESRPTYVETGAAPQPGGRSGDRPYFGSIPDFNQGTEGYKISGVANDGPAGKAGLQGGDVIVQLGESKVGNLDDFDSALRKYKAGEKVNVVVKRGEQELTLEVVLDPPR